MAGVYAFLPLGLRVLERIKQIVREEMNAIGGEEILMTTLQRKELWEKTDRWNDENVDVWFKASLHAGGEVGFGWSHEEPITAMMKEHIRSFRDLPVYVYQFQTKLRNELRAKSGIMRGREFIMKDMYSYTVDEASHQEFYANVIEAYRRVFARVGIGDRTFLTVASGGAFTDFSHEFQTLVNSGEDTVYLNRGKKIAVNEEVMRPDVLKKLGVEQKDLEKVPTTEVGNIFDFGTIKSKQLDLSFKDKEGNDTPVHLGSYGIGITRLMGVLVEIFSDEKGIVWPLSVAPFAVHLILLDGDEKKVRESANALYEKLTERGIEVLYDERDVRAGEKFADADLIGIPKRVVVSKKTMASGVVEVTERTMGKTEMVSEAALVETLL